VVARFGRVRRRHRASISTVRVRVRVLSVFVRAIGTESRDSECGTYSLHELYIVFAVRVQVVEHVFCRRPTARLARPCPSPCPLHVLLLVRVPLLPKGFEAIASRPERMLAVVSHGDTFSQMMAECGACAVRGGTPGGQLRRGGRENDEGGARRVHASSVRCAG
jgi:hypothetical protein